MDEMRDLGLDFGHPEMQTGYAMGLYLRCFPTMDYTYHRPVPRSAHSSPFYQEMWHYLEEAALQDWISPFLLRRAEEAQAAGYPLPKVIRTALLIREEEAAKEELSRRQKLAHCCSKPGCRVRVEREMRCSKCRYAKYCSREYQVAHWPQHKKECKLLAAQLPSPIVQPQPTAVASTGSKAVTTTLADGSKFTITSSSIDANALKLLEKSRGNDDSSPDTAASQYSVAQLLRSQATSQSATELENTADALRSELKFQAAAKCYTYAIDKLHVASGNTYGHKLQERAHLLRLYQSKVSCNVQCLEMLFNEALANDVLDDCEFIVDSGAFEGKCEGDESDSEGEEGNAPTERDPSQRQDTVRLQAECSIIMTTISELKHRASAIIEVALMPPPVPSVPPPTAAIPAPPVPQPAPSTAVSPVFQRRVMPRQPSRAELRRQQRADEMRKQLERAKPKVEAGCVFHCAELMSTGHAANSDKCAICLTSWNGFYEQPALATVLSCYHGYCLGCLSSYEAECKKSFSQETARGELEVEYRCCLCREEVPTDLTVRLATRIVVEDSRDHAFLNASVVSRLGLDFAERQELFVSTIRSCRFQMQRVNEALLNMVGLVGRSVPSNRMTHEEKRKHYDQAKAPVVALQAEIDETRSALERVFDTDSERFQSLRQKLSALIERIKVAEANAANDIFERNNQAAHQEASADQEVQVDLHGLTVKEAIGKVEELVLPVLAVCGTVHVITGRGVHSSTALRSELKVGLIAYFKQKGIKCALVPKNDGVLKVNN